MSRDITGEKNPRWNGGASEYPGHYLLKIARIEKLKAVKGKCEICDGRARLVHHIDGSVSNHKISNLLAVCYSCHKAIHAVEKNGTGNSKSKYKDIYGMKAEDIAELTGLSYQKIRMWTESPKKRELIMQMIKDERRPIIEAQGQV